MFTRPNDVTDREVAEVVSAHWGFDLQEIAYRPVGFGSHHWRVRTPSDAWFVTVDDLVAKRHDPAEPLDEVRARLMAALMTAWALRDAGCELRGRTDPLTRSRDRPPAG